MPRPTKRRRVCYLPSNNLFGPMGPGKGKRDIITMSVDEYETTRLIDLEELTQEECALRMDVARTTVQRMYNIARKKIATALSQGAILKIEGGNYTLCDTDEVRSGCGRCRRHGNNKGNCNEKREQT